jgi:hypothetical protein
MANRCYDKEIRYDGVVVYKFKSTTHACMDMWFDDVAAVFAEAIKSQASVRLMYDVRGIRSPSPYALQRAQDLSKLPLPDDWRVATLTKNAFATNIINFIRKMSLSSDTANQSRIFSSEVEALVWLLEP